MNKTLHYNISIFIIQFDGYKYAQEGNYYCEMCDEELKVGWDSTYYEGKSGLVFAICNGGEFYATDDLLEWNEPTSTRDFVPCVLGY